MKCHDCQKDFELKDLRHIRVTGIGVSIPERRWLYCSKCYRKIYADGVKPHKDDFAVVIP